MTQTSLTSFPAMNTKPKELRKVELDDLRPYAAPTSPEGEDILIVEDFSRIDFAGKAFKSDFFLIGFCESGVSDFFVNSRPVTLQAGDFYILFGQQVVDRVKQSPDFHLVALVQDRNYVQETLISMLHLWPYLFHLMESPVLRLTPDEQATLHRSYNTILQRLSNRGHTFWRESVRTMMQTFYFDICDAVERRNPQRERFRSRLNFVFYNFMQILSANYFREREVAWYAERLKLTPKYLSEVVKQVSGRTVSSWISSMVVMEIKNRLRNTDHSVKEIATQLHFPNQSFLGKYFKNLVGISPLDYRRLSEEDTLELSAPNDAVLS